MIDWYFSKLGAVLGLALAFAVGVVALAGAVSVVVGVLDRDRTKRRGFEVTRSSETTQDESRGDDP